MKRMLKIMMLALASIMMLSCEKEPDSIQVEFSRAYYELYTGGTTDIVVTLDAPALGDLSIPLSFAGDADRESYSYSSETVGIKAGETSGFVTVKDEGLKEGVINLSIVSAPSGYALGSRSRAVVTPASSEALIYSFSVAEADVLEQYEVTMTISGTTSGEDFAAPSEMRIPFIYTLGPDVAEGSVVFSSEEFVVEAGGNMAKVTVSAEGEMAENAFVTMTVDRENAPRFIPGDIPEIKLNLKGVLGATELLGSWEFEKVYGLADIEEFFFMEDDDPDLLPTHNKGFILTFSQEPNGDLRIAPSGAVDADWQKLFRESQMSLTAPMNIDPEGRVIGKYTTTENPMFMEMDIEGDIQLTYYKLANANRAFNSDDEKLGEITIALRITPEGALEVHLRDYDTPPFGTNWWAGSGFDPEMFGFASLFKKITR